MKSDTKPTIPEVIINATKFKTSKNKEMSRKDEIKKALRKHTIEIVLGGFKRKAIFDINAVATEIEKLFEVEGKVVKGEEILQYTSTGVWYDYSKSIEEADQEIRTIRDNAVIRCKDTNYKFRLVYRFTIDKIIDKHALQ